MNAAVLSVLVVEDEFLIAMALEDILRSAGYRVLGPVANVAAALRLLTQERPDAAVLDVQLRGERVTAVAAVLRSMGVPFLLASAISNAEAEADRSLRGAVNVGKPTDTDALLDHLARLSPGRP